MQTKRQLIDALAERTHQSKTASAAFIDALEALLQEALAADDQFSLPGIGRFMLKNKSARTARNPRTGEAVHVAARKSIAFKATKSLKDVIETP